MILRLLVICCFCLLQVPAGASQNLVSVKDFGAIGDGSADDTAAIQLAINTALSGSSSVSSAIYFPKGTYKITDMLVIARKKADNSGFLFAEGVNLIGETQPYPDTGIPTSRIITAFPAIDRAAIVIQSGRNVRIKDLEITGQNNIQGISPNFCMTLSNFLMPGVRNNRYSPHAGIVIDPFSSGVADLDQYPGWSSYYIGSSGGSSQTYVEGCFIRKFAVDLLTSPTTNGQGDNLVMRDCMFQLATVGVASGQSQTRAGRMDTCSGYGLGTFVSVGDYGTYAGTMPEIVGGQVSFCKYLFSSTDQSRGNFHVSGLYAESICSIGSITSGAVNAETATISGCAFSFQPTQPTVDYRLLSAVPVHFEGCEIDTAAGGPLHFANPYGSLKFTNCQFYADVSVEKQNPQLYFSNLAAVSFDHCNLVDRQGDRTVLSQDRVIDQTYLMDRQSMSLGSLIQRIGDSSLYRVLPELVYPVTGGGYTLDGMGGATMAANVNASFYQPGDMVDDSSNSSVEAPPALGGHMTVAHGYFGRVAQSVNGAITLDCVAQGAVTGHGVGVSWLPRWHGATTGDGIFPFTIVNVSNPGAWAVGDHIRGADIVLGTYITAISGNTFTLSYYAPTGTGIRLYDADVQIMTGVLQ